MLTEGQCEELTFTSHLSDPHRREHEGKALEIVANRLAEKEVVTECYRHGSIVLELSESLEDFAMHWTQLCMTRCHS